MQQDTVRVRTAHDIVCAAIDRHMDGSVCVPSKHFVRNFRHVSTTARFCGMHRRGGAHATFALCLLDHIEFCHVNISGLFTFIYNFNAATELLACVRSVALFKEFSIINPSISKETVVIYQTASSQSCGQQIRMSSSIEEARYCQDRNVVLQAQYRCQFGTQDSCRQ